MAAANTHIALGLGMEVFLGKRNPSYDQEAKKGGVIHSTSDFEENGIKALTSMSECDKIKWRHNLLPAQ